LNWGFFLETYLIFDFSILMVILISAIFAFMRGFSQEILSLFSWIVAISGSYFFANNFVNLINKFTENIVFSRILSYVIVFLVLIFFLSFLAKIFSNTIKKSYVGMLDRTLGFVFGIIRGYLIVSLCFYSFYKFYDGENVDWIDKSKFDSIIKKTNFKILKIINFDDQYSNKLGNEIQKKSEKLFEKSIDSRLKLKNSLDNRNEVYPEGERNMMQRLIENSD
tara:strand:- start:536 stop:1201 length:666 start_codon:yes stop_codon:yes gene_type:complete